MTRWRLLKALAIALLIAIALIAFSDAIRAQDDDPCAGAEDPAACYLIYVPPPPCRCASLQAYGWWWFFWGCNIDPCNGTLFPSASEQQQLTALVSEETVISQEIDGSWRVEVRRVYLDGRIVVITVTKLRGDR